MNAKAATITVKKAGAETVISSTYASEDNTKIYIVTQAKLSKGDYDISVSGLSSNAITKTVSAEDERLDKIEYTSDKAAIVPVFDDTVENHSVYVYFKLLNQYSEDITASYSAYSQNIASNAGVFEVNDKYADRGRLIVTNKDDEFFYGESIPMSTVYKSDVTTVTAVNVLTVGSKAAIGEINILKLYNENGNKLRIDSTYSSYYLLLDLKDQYGNKIFFDADEALIKDDLIVTSSDSSVVTFTKGTNGYYNYQNLVIDGVGYIALPIEKPSDSQVGNALVTFVSTTTGKMAQYAIEVGDIQYAASFSMQAPDLAVLGEKTIIPFTAYDVDGNEITDIDTLASSLGDYNVIFSVSGAEKECLYFERNPSTGKAQLVFNSVGSNILKEGDVVTLTSMTGKTYQVYSISFKLNAPKEPVVDGISSSYLRQIVQGAFADFRYDSLIFEDNYGRPISTGEIRYQDISNLGVSIDGNTTYSARKYRIVVNSNSDNVKVIGGYSVSDDVYCIGYNPADGRFYEKVHFYGAKEGTAVITAQVQENINDGLSSTANWRNVTDSSYSFTMNTVGRSNVKSIAVDTIPISYDYNWYDDNKNNYGLKKTRTYSNAFSVYGVLSDGSKAWLSKQILPGNTTGLEDAYTISFSEDKLTTGTDSTVVGDVYQACLKQKFIFKNLTDTLNNSENQSVNVPFSITPSSTYFNNVDSISGSFTVSSADPTITSIALTYNQFAQLSSDGASIEITQKDLNTLKAWANSDMNKVICKIVADAVIIKDQYGKEHDSEYLASNSDIYIIQFKYSYGGFGYPGDRVDVTVTTNNGGKSIAFTIIIK